MSSISRIFVKELVKRNAQTCVSRNMQSRSLHQMMKCASSSVVNANMFQLKSSNLNQLRAFSDKKPEEETEDKKPEEETAESQEETSDNKVEKLESELKEMKDQLLRSLAEQENIRRIAKRDVENARNFAVSSFAKSLLDTSDNLSRAMEAVPEEYRTDTENHPVLATLYEGIQMTDDGLTKAFAKNGLKKFGAPGDKFDPNMHEALFEYPDENMEAGSVGQVMKVGFSLNDRVIRPAEVGVTKKA